jgi:hypothetical protein
MRRVTGIIFTLGLVLTAACGTSDIGSDEGHVIMQEETTYEDYLAGEASIDELVSADLGLWVVHRPGAIDAIERVGSAAELFERFAWLEESIALPACNLGEGMPEADCERDDYLPADQCWAGDTAEEFDRLSSLQEALVEYELADPNQALMAELKEIEARVEVRAVVGGQDTVLYFGRVDGSWRLLVVDTAEMDCSA